MEMFLIIGGIIAVVGLIIGLGWYFEKKRTEAIQQLAEALGLDFVGNSDPSILGEVANFALFQQGHSRTVRNLLQGETDIAKIQIFDYRYVTGSGKHQSTHSQTVVSMVSDQIQAPAFDLRPEGFFSKLTQWLGAKDINFDNHKEFSDAFLLSGPDEAAVRHYFDTELLDFFCQRKQQNVSVNRGELIFFRARQTSKPEQWKELMAEGFAVYQALLSRQERKTDNRVDTSPF